MAARGTHSLRRRALFMKSIDGAMLSEHVDYKRRVGVSDERGLTDSDTVSISSSDDLVESNSRSCVLDSIISLTLKTRTFVDTGTMRI